MSGKFAFNALMTLFLIIPIYTYNTRSSQEGALDCHDECQNQIHVLNSCKVALDARWYNERHGGALRALVDTIMKKIAKGLLLTADQQDGYNFPSHIVCTDLRPNIMCWDDGKREK